VTSRYALIAIPVAAFGLGYWVAPKEHLDSEVQHTGFMKTETQKVLSATVESLRSENKMLVFAYKGSVTVESKTQYRIPGTDRYLPGVEGVQTLVVPFVNNYYLDLSKLTLADISYNEQERRVTVRLPAVEMGDVAFQPERAVIINNGLLTFSQATVDDLMRKSYGSARRAAIAQAQQPGMKQQAQKNAVTNIQTYFEIPLRIVGQPDVKVVATF
jgi:hypothetical protein